MTLAASASPAWLKQSVQQFLLHVNWDNQPPDLQTLRLAAAQPNQQLSLLLPVNQFFGIFNWDGPASGQPLAAAALPDADTKADAFTLNDFSGLF
jgi:hypothetical protein